MDGDTGRLSALKYKLICHLKLPADMVGGGIREFVYDMDEIGFLKMELVGFGVDSYWYVRVHDHTSGPVLIQKSLTTVHRPLVEVDVI